MHSVFSDALILKGEGNVLTYSQSDKLSVCVLKHGADILAYLVDVAFLCLNAVDFQTSFNNAAQRMGNKTVDAVSDSALAAAGRTCDQDFLSVSDLQVYIVKSRTGLAFVLKGKV